MLICKLRLIWSDLTASSNLKKSLFAQQLLGVVDVIG